MEMYRIVLSGDELYHHGVLGMKWGVRRYQNPDGSLTPEGLKQQRYNRAVRKAVNKGIASDTTSPQYEVGTTIFKNQTYDAGKEYVSGLINDHDFDWQEVVIYEDKGKEIFENGGNPSLKYDSSYYEPAAYKLQKNATHKIPEDYSLLNGNYISTCNSGFGKPGQTQNCAKCSSYLELALHGYAGAKDSDGQYLGMCAGRQTYPSSADAPELWWNGAKNVNYDSIDSCDQSLRSYGPKTSGTLSFQYKTGGGHAVHWTNDADGNFTVEDGQSDHIFNSISEMVNSYAGVDTSQGFSTYRLDNCTPNWDAMAQDSVVRISETNNGSDYVYGKVRNRFDNRVVDRW